MQKSQKGPTCFYYSIQMIRNSHRIGKNPPEELKNQRKIEAYFSSIRKKITENELLKEKVSLNLFSENSNRLNDLFEEVFERFHFSDDDIRPFLSKALETPSDWRESHIFLLFADLVGFKRSTWNPFQTIIQLIKELTLQGPLLVTGKFGRVFYKNSPDYIESIAGRSVVGWKKGDIKSDKEIDLTLGRVGHAIVLVGAKIESIKGQKKGFVYYLDPNDESFDDRNQRFYMISFERFLKVVSPLDGVRLKLFGKQIPQKSRQNVSNYGLYLPKIPVYKEKYEHTPFFY